MYKVSCIIMLDVLECFCVGHVVPLVHLTPTVHCASNTWEVWTWTRDMDTTRTRIHDKAIL